MLEKNQAGLYESEIDGRKYEFEKWGAEQSLRIILKISKMSGKSFGMLVGTLMSGDGKFSLSKEVSPDLLGGAFEALANNMNEDECMEIIKKLTAANILCDGKRIKFDTHYQDSEDINGLLHLFSVLKTALEVQYGNFLGVLFAVSGFQKKPGITNQAPTM